MKSHDPQQTSACPNPTPEPVKVTPWPAPAGVPVLLFGGSFDPPHAAHVEIARAVRDAVFGSEGWLVYVPASRSPHKPTGPVAADAHRVAMLGLAIGDDKRSAVWTDEIDRMPAGSCTVCPSYWVDTLERAHRVIDAGTPLRFLIGADQAIAFDRWHEHEKIIELAEPAVVLREPLTCREAFRRMLIESGLDPARWMPWIVETDLHPAASTDIRASIGRGRTPAGMLDPAVAEYIAEHGLYCDRG